MRDGPDQAAHQRRQRQAAANLVAAAEAAMGGIGEMISDGVEGRLVSGAPPDIEGLARACLDYFRDPELRLRHGAAGAGPRRGARR